MNRQQKPERRKEEPPGPEIQQGDGRSIATDERLKRVIKQHPQCDEPKVDSVEPGEYRQGEPRPHALTDEPDFVALPPPERNLAQPLGQALVRRRSLPGFWGVGVEGRAGALRDCLIDRRPGDATQTVRYTGREAQGEQP